MNLTPLFEALGVTRVHVHHAAEAMDRLGALLTAVGVKYDLSVHDYALVCPRTNLARDGIYCGEPETLGCLACLAAKPEPRAVDIIWWRERGRALMEGADRVICPSADAADRMQRYAPKARIVAAPHEASLYRPRGGEAQAATLGADEPLRVVALGVLSENKGGAFLLSCVEAAKTSAARISWTVIGELPSPLDLRAKKLSNVLEVTGAYKSADLSRLISSADPHLIFFPQHIPETYSYTLSEAFSAARPILAPRLGAFPERLAGREGAWLYSIDAPADEIVRLILKLRDSVAQGEFLSDLGVSASLLRTKVVESFFEGRYLADSS